MKDLLRFITCGSVDDGKSTLIGHILYDSKLLYADQKKALELESKVGSRGGDIDYSLLLDGLTEEREQGITIDVAYRYFTTDSRSFIVADTPGHEEYTRNMAVGASFADLAVILIDARKGVLTQSRRHARICSVMGIRNYVFAVNKMDLVEYDEEIFKGIVKHIDILRAELGLQNVKIIPVSATEGDNVTRRSDNMPWYGEEPLLEYLENVDINAGDAENGFYLPVQRVCRPDHNFRGFQGQIESGNIRVGDEISVVPGGEKAGVKRIYVADKETDEASAGQPVTIQLDREIDISRGNVIVKDIEVRASSGAETTLIWMDDNPLKKGGSFYFKLGTALIPGVVSEILYKIDVNTGAYIKADEISKNEICLCRISFSDSIPIGKFKDHRSIGELILIDRVSFMTSACGVVEKVTSDVAEDKGRISEDARSAAMGQQAVTVIFKESEEIDKELLWEVEKKLILEGRNTYFIDAGEKKASEENINTLKTLNDAGLVVLLLVSGENYKTLGTDLHAVTYRGKKRDRDGLADFVKEVSCL